jgi:DNA repair exonuclease SbcCD ATPase subunit
MQITSITVEGVGKFAARSQLKGLGPGVNVLSAGNEAGKSTIFKAVRACLFDRHNSKTSELRKLSCDGAQLPVTITIGFEQAGESYSITKSFLRSASAALIRGGSVIARNHEADEQVWEILGLSSGPRDDAAYGLLWVKQGESFKAPEPSEEATSALNAIIQAEVGDLVGGERARLAMKDLDEELGAFVTESTGRAKAGGPLASSQAHLKKVDEDLADDGKRLAVLEGQFTTLASKRRERAKLSDPEELRRMEDGLAAAEKGVRDADAAEAALKGASSAEIAAKATLDRLTGMVDDFRRRADRIDGNRRRAAEIAAELEPIDVKEGASRDFIARARKEIENLDGQAASNDRRERKLSHLAGVIEQTAKREALARLLATLEDFAERQAENAAGLANNKATGEASKRIDELEREILGLTARLEASAASVSVLLGSEASNQVHVGDRVISRDEQFSAVEPLVVKVGAIASVTISPPKNFGAADHKKLQNAQGERAKLAADAGVNSIAEFRATRERRSLLETEALGLQAEFKALGVAEKSPAAAIESLKVRLAGIDQNVAEAVSACEADRLPSADEIAREQDEARRDREAERTQRNKLHGAIDAQNTILAGLASTKGRFQGERAALATQLHADLAILPDGQREALLAKSQEDLDVTRRDHEIKAAALEDRRRQSPDADEIERRRNQVKRLSLALNGQKERLGGLDKEIANIEGQIENAGGDGLGEKVDELRQIRDLASRDVERIEGRVKTLQLLKSVIDECYCEQQDRLQAPLRRHLKPYLNDVFPLSDIELGEGFTIDGLKRNGANAEDFKRLSDGTQEQIAVLVRLAMGAMLCERGDPAPIILDDALVFSDDERIEQMFDALTRAGEIQQVIVLTCRSRAFSRLGGNMLSIETMA